MITSLKQRKIKFKPRIKLKHVTIVIFVSVVEKKHSNPVQNKAFRKLVLMFRETSRRQVML